ncbi:hypothetical protein COO60DRAFT_1461367 [Scenedesmus sp. NREL 46B-D3]|nr:hypothetical protein COO60DRAFT_1461367 [Scenedesmus sp. NREL 46B-D3]
MTGGNVTSINLASSSQKKVQSTSDILKQIESTFTENRQDSKYKQEELSSRILGKINQHEAAFGDQHLPRQRLPKVGAVLLDRYQAARRNVLVLGAIKQAAKHASRPNMNRSGKSSNAAERGLDSAFTSFAGSRAASGSLAGQEVDISPEASGAGPNGFTAAGAAASGRPIDWRGERGTVLTASRGQARQPKPGRVTTAMAQYGSQDDWMSKTLLKHYLASVIQARWRGHQVRKRWADQEGRPAFVEEQKAKLEAGQLHQQRLRELEQKLLARRAKQQAQATAAAVAAAAGSSEDCPDSNSDSGWSDVELDDVASIKFRAVTPPWQKVSEQACMGQRLRRRVAAATAAATGQAMPEGWGGAGDEGFEAMLGAAGRAAAASAARACRRPSVPNVCTCCSCSCVIAASAASRSRCTSRTLLSQQQLPQACWQQPARLTKQQAPAQAATQKTLQRQPVQTGRCRVRLSSRCCWKGTAPSMSAWGCQGRCLAGGSGRVCSRSRAAAAQCRHCQRMQCSKRLKRQGWNKERQAELGSRQQKQPLMERQHSRLAVEQGLLVAAEQCCRLSSQLQ